MAPISLPIWNKQHGYSLKLSIAQNHYKMNIPTLVTHNLFYDAHWSSLTIVFDFRKDFWSRFYSRNDFWESLYFLNNFREPLYYCDIRAESRFTPDIPSMGSLPLQPWFQGLLFSRERFEGRFSAITFPRAVIFLLVLKATSLLQYFPRTSLLPRRYGIACKEQSSGGGGGGVGCDNGGSFSRGLFLQSDPGFGLIFKPWCRFIHCLLNLPTRVILVNLSKLHPVAVILISKHLWKKNTN